MGLVTSAGVFDRLVARMSGGEQSCSAASWVLLVLVLLLPPKVFTATFIGVALEVGTEWYMVSQGTRGSAATSATLQMGAILADMVGNATAMGMTGMNGGLEKITRIGRTGESSPVMTVSAMQTVPTTGTAKVRRVRLSGMSGSSCPTCAA